MTAKGKRKSIKAKVWSPKPGWVSITFNDAEEVCPVTSVSPPHKVEYGNDVGGGGVPRIKIREIIKKFFDRGAYKFEMTANTLSAMSHLPPAYIKNMVERVCSDHNVQVTVKPHPIYKILIKREAGSVGIYMPTAKKAGFYPLADIYGKPISLTPGKPIDSRVNYKLDSFLKKLLRAGFVVDIHRTVMWIIGEPENKYLIDELGRICPPDWFEIIDL
jgi:hypothetical protein